MEDNAALLLLQQAMEKNNGPTPSSFSSSVLPTDPWDWSKEPQLKIDAGTVIKKDRQPMSKSDYKELLRSFYVWLTEDHQSGAITRELQSDSEQNSFYDPDSETKPWYEDHTYDKRKQRPKTQESEMVEKARKMLERMLDLDPLAIKGIQERCTYVLKYDFDLGTDVLAIDEKMVYIECAGTSTISRKLPDRLNSTKISFNWRKLAEAGNRPSNGGHVGGLAKDVGRLHEGMLGFHTLTLKSEVPNDKESTLRDLQQLPASKSQPSVEAEATTASNDMADLTTAIKGIMTTSEDDPDTLLQWLSKVGKAHELRFDVSGT
ncbi:hypothetical protein M231_06083 [Tremella mesenterica]|uniref:Uncharacterized protein n=1 Tax=Tremella mesenterica TaxID=5217 RepID=A0A4V1M3E8_TREME|nr:hypothetical protein M231_06083 [Tremella mesenterica]